MGRARVLGLEAPGAERVDESARERERDAEMTMQRGEGCACY